MNAIVTITDGLAVTTTLAIAEGTGVEHKAVIQLVRTYLTDLGEFGRVTFEMRPFETAGGMQRREVAILNEQQSTLLLTYMRNSEIVRSFKKRLVREFWQMAEKLRGQPASDPMAVLSDPAAMRGLLLNYTEKVIALEEKVAEQAPKVAFAKQVEVAPDAIDIAKAAKLLGTGRTRLMAFLREIRWINRYNQPYQDKIEAGLLDTKLGKWEHPDHGLQQSVTTLVTGKGLVKLQKLWDERQQTIKAAGMMSVASRDHGSIGSQPESQHV